MQQKLHRKALFSLCVAIFCLANKSRIDRNWLFKSLCHRKLLSKNAFQIFPWLITYCEWTQGNLFKPFFACCFQKSRFSLREQITVCDCLGSLGYNVASQSILNRYICRMCTVSSWTPKKRGYEKQVWLLFTTQSYLFHSLSCQVAMMFGKSTQSVVVCTLTPTTTQVGDY